MQYDPASGQTSVYRGQAEFTNGRALPPLGVVHCSHGRRALEIDTPDGPRILTDRVGEHRLNSPNDIAVAPDGALWFTDGQYEIAVLKARAMEAYVKACPTASVLPFEDSPIAEAASRMPALVSTLCSTPTPDTGTCTARSGESELSGARREARRAGGASGATGAEPDSRRAEKPTTEKPTGGRSPEGNTRPSASRVTTQSMQLTQPSTSVPWIAI